MQQFPEVSKIGVIADTHGLLRSQALEALAGSDLIIHAGDVGKAAVLEQLQEVAPVVAIRGNVDHGAWAVKLPLTETILVDRLRLHVLHDLRDLEMDPAKEGIAAVISAHSHRPRLEQKQGVLYLNPGSAGPRRFTLPISLGRLYITEGQVQGELVELVV